MSEPSHIFDLDQQQEDVAGKIVVGLERISEAFRVLLRQAGKTWGLSPIQIQILIFIKYHEEAYCGVSYLAKEFNVAKPTISDAVKSLEKKGLVKKSRDGADSRSFVIQLSSRGAKMVASLEDFAQPVTGVVRGLAEPEQERLFASISQIIYRLHLSGIISVQRTCYACKYFHTTDDGNYCQLIQTKLEETDIRLDCPEFKVG